MKPKWLGWAFGWIGSEPTNLLNAIWLMEFITIPNQIATHNLKFLFSLGLDKTEIYKISKQFNETNLMPLFVYLLLQSCSLKKFAIQEGEQPNFVLPNFLYFIKHMKDNQIKILLLARSKN